MRFSKCYENDKDKRFIPKYEVLRDYLDEKEAKILYNIADTLHFSSIIDHNKMIIIHPSSITALFENVNGEKFELSFLSPKYGCLSVYTDRFPSNFDVKNGYNLMNYHFDDDYSKRKLVLNTEDHDVAEFFSLIEKAKLMNQFLEWSRNLMPYKTYL